MSAGDAQLTDLICHHRGGHALEQGFYLREDVFAHDMGLLLDRWTFVGHVSEVGEPGDWLTAELGAESAIVARDEGGALRAFANVCRHRGSRLLAAPAGHALAITCPYHAWTYRLDGTLRGAREMGADFEPAGHGLKPLPLAIIGGLIFVSFGPSPPALDDVEAALGSMTARYDWEHARVAHKRRYRVAANWKLALENYHECYHCAPAHPEFAARHALARPKGRPMNRAGDVEAWGAGPDGREPARVMTSALNADSLTGSADGAYLAPEMYRQGGTRSECVFAEAGFLSAFLAYADHGVTYRFIPLGPVDTAFEVAWLVRGDAVEGRDYDLAKLVWLWDVTSAADKTIIEANQAGVRSRFYEPGPYSPMEPGARAFTDRYLGELAARAGVA